MTTTTKVKNSVRARLRQIARDRGATVRGMVGRRVDAVPARAELDARGEAAIAYVRQHINPDLCDVDLAVAERFWSAIEAGRLPKVNELYQAHIRAA